MYLLISHETALSGILKLTDYLCGNLWKPPVKFPEVAERLAVKETKWKPRVDVSRCGNLVETT